MTKHIFVTGGVISSLGKGITAASMTMLLKNRGYRVAMQKLDPYLNVDPGKMCPLQHGEVFVTDDGAERDLDLGHYERFADITCTHNSGYASGRLYMDVLQNERKGVYGGGTVQVIPHITNAIKDAIRSLASPDIDIAVTEIGGTVGDMESLPYIEAIRQFRHDVGEDNAIFIHLTLVPYIKACGEMKTKPSQQSTGILRGIGIIPDVLACRCERPLDRESLEKLAMFCNVRKDLVFSAQDVTHNVYEIVTDLAEQEMDVKILQRLGLPVNVPDLSAWKSMLDAIINPKNGIVKVAVVGKYTATPDAYKSLVEALTHGGAANSAKVKAVLIQAERFESENPETLLEGMDAVVVPDAYNRPFITGELIVTEFARQNNLPFLGINTGMQCAIVEVAKHVAKIPDATTLEHKDATGSFLIHKIDQSIPVRLKDNELRVGAYAVNLDSTSLIAKIYGCNLISERHRHAYVFNTQYQTQLESAGVRFSASNHETHEIQALEIPACDFFVATLFHPEYKSRPLTPHPLFAALIAAALKGRV